jgi:hypothetical protein
MGLLRIDESWVTSLPPEEARAALAAKVKPGPLLRLEGDDVRVPFRGEVSLERVRIVRRAIVRNSFVPVVSGSLTGEGAGTRISLALEPHPAMAIFVAVWAVAALASVAVAFFSAHDLALSLLPVLVLPLLGPVLLLLAFRVEVPNTVELLKQALPPA